MAKCRRQMINALVNGHWKLFNKDQLQPGSDLFDFETGLYETFRTLKHKPIFLKPHLDRLFDSAKQIGLQIFFTREEVEDMIEEVIEPYLLQQGLIQRTPRGRALANGGWAHLGLSPPKSSGDLFNSINS